MILSFIFLPSSLTSFLRSFVHLFVHSFVIHSFIIEKKLKPGGPVTYVFLGIITRRNQMFPYKCQVHETKFRNRLETENSMHNICTNYKRLCHTLSDSISVIRSLPTPYITHSVAAGLLIICCDPFLYFPSFLPNFLPSFICSLVCSFVCHSFIHY